MNLMESIEKFCKDEEQMSIFKAKGYSFIVSKGWFRLIDNNTMEDEKLIVLNDENNKNRIRFKGKNFAFSLNFDNKEDIYLDHLLIGDVEKEEFFFSMRHNILKENEEFIIKFINNNNEKVIFNINNKFLAMIKKDKDNNEKKFYVHKNELGMAWLPATGENYAYELYREIINLLRYYPNLIDYIIKKVPFFNSCITEIYESKNNEIMSTNTKPYETKRILKLLTREEFDEIIAEAQRHNFRVISNEEEPTKVYDRKINY